MIFFSDNAAVWMGTNERPYRGHIFRNYEGGHRVPAAMKWPGHIEAGWESDEMIVGMDILPTVMDIVGIDIPKERDLDGISVKAHLLNQVDIPDRQVFFGYEPKLGTATRDGHWKMQTKENTIELYDLSKDIKNPQQNGRRTEIKHFWLWQGRRSRPSEDSRWSLTLSRDKTSRLNADPFC